MFATGGGISPPPQKERFCSLQEMLREEPLLTGNMLLCKAAFPREEKIVAGACRRGEGGDLMGLSYLEERWQAGDTKAP